MTVWTFGAAAMTGRGKKNVADARRKDVERRRWSTGQGRGEVKLNMGLAWEIQLLSCYWIGFVLCGISSEAA